MPKPTSPTLPTRNGRPSRCRGRGGRMAVGLLGLALAGALGAFALRASGQGPRMLFSHGPMAHGFCGGGTCSAADVDRHVTRAVGWLVDDLKGTPEQEQKLSAIARAAAADLVPLKLQAQENHLQAVAILTGETVDRAALEAVRARQIDLATRASARLTKAIADAADVLTPAQRVELAERVKKLHG